MIKIEPIDLRTLENNEHFQFMVGFDNLVCTHKASVMGSEILYNVFKNTLMAEDLAFRVEQGSSVLLTLDRLDRQRDKTWYAINMRIKATLQSPLEEEVQSAQVVEKIINLYGDICALTNGEQSEAITSLTDDLQHPVIDLHINKLGLSEWVSELKRQNEKFKSVLKDRNSEFVGRESNDVKAARTLLDPVYLQLVERINASLILEFALPEVITFAGKLNEKINYFKTPLVYRNSSSKVGIKEEV